MHEAFESVVEQRVDGNAGIIGVMLESNINPGSQKINGDFSKLEEYGVSITDPCIGWQETEDLLRLASIALGARTRARRDGSFPESRTTRPIGSCDTLPQLEMTDLKPPTESWRTLRRLSVPWGITDAMIGFASSLAADGVVLRTWATALGSSLAQSQQTCCTVLSVPAPGFPDVPTSIEIAEAVLRNGGDLLEVGVPFSDPVADGPTVQKTSFHALQQGPMAKIRGIRGATIADDNTQQAILGSHRRVAHGMVESNDVDVDDIAAAYFTTTQDLNASFPLLLPDSLAGSTLPSSCAHEMKVPNAMQRVIRVMLLVNTDRKPRRSSSSISVGPTHCASAW
ncbi:Chorismate mutase AroH [Geodia barretti]|uniref:tryptophan synthase n=1 Tax=Geodia barretti TaxID=519541 RepID=A0AA35XF46_GEOBA|nr:Chorismate mutase AroH [Geodia barretti]